MATIDTAAFAAELAAYNTALEALIAGMAGRVEPAAREALERDYRRAGQALAAAVREAAATAERAGEPDVAAA